MNSAYGLPGLVIAAAVLVLGTARLIVGRSIRFYEDNHVERADPPFEAARRFHAQISVALWFAIAGLVSLFAHLMMSAATAWTITAVGTALGALAMHRHWPDLAGRS